MTPRILVIGIPAIGAQGLPSHILDRVRAADVLCGGKRHLALFPGIGRERWTITDNIPALADRLSQIRDRQVVVLSSGDPLLFGIGAALVRYLGAEHLEIIPHVSAMQEAFARLGIPWHDARIVSAHGRPIEPVLATVLAHPKVAIYTDPSNTPAHLAQRLLAAGSPDRRTVIAERLGEAEERVHQLTLSTAVRLTFDPLNVMLVLEQVGAGRLPLPSSWDPDDKALMQWRGQITRQEVRALSLLRLAPQPTSIVWDVGAGSGAVAIDIARRVPLGRVFAIERDPEQQNCVRTNVERTGVNSVTLVEGEAPEVFGLLPDPHAIFIGGTGGKLTAILERCWERLLPGGRMVTNLVVLDHLSECLAWCARVRVTPDVLLVQLSRGTPILGSFRLEALNPVHIITVCRERKEDHGRT